MKTFAIVGDSYSTYKDYVPEGYHFWYAPEGNECENDMPSVEKTWWKLLEKERKLVLIFNCSYSGSAVCYSGYEDMEDKIGSSFVERVKQDFSEGKIQPDLLILFGGTNDFWAGSPLGKLKYENWNKEDFMDFGPSFCFVLDYLKKECPQTRIINVINDEITSEIRPMMKEACQYYGIPVLELSNVTKENGHPNTEGMEQIEEQIEKYLIS